jgi:hypothetical protein
LTEESRVLLPPKPDRFCIYIVKIAVNLMEVEMCCPAENTMSNNTAKNMICVETSPVDLAD